MSLGDLVRASHSPSSLSKDLDQFLIQRPPDYREDGWHVSEFCSICARKRVLEELLSLLKPSSFPPRVLRLFDVGTALHAWYQNEYFGPMGTLWGKWECVRCRSISWGFRPTSSCTDTSDSSLTKGCLNASLHLWRYREVPVRVSQGLTRPIVGHGDGILYANGVWNLLEIKTINQNGFQRLAKPNEAHCRQARVYCELLRSFGVDGFDGDVPDLQEVLLFYINKNKSEETEFRIGLGTEFAEAQIQKPYEVEYSLKDKKLPPRDTQCSSLSDRGVKSCSVGTYCFGTLGWVELEAIGKAKR